MPILTSTLNDMSPSHGHPPHFRELAPPNIYFVPTPLECTHKPCLHGTQNLKWTRILTQTIVSMLRPCNGGGPGDPVSRKFGDPRPHIYSKYGDPLAKTQDWTHRARYTRPAPLYFGKSHFAPPPLDAGILSSKHIVCLFSL